MAFTQQITVSSTADTAVVAQSPTQQIRVTENRGVAGWPTGDFLVKKPGAGNTAVRIPSGASYTFQVPAGRSYLTGETAGYLRTLAGSTTFDQDEGP